MNELLGSREFRVLVVEDHEPFRRFICSKLQQRPNLEVVGELEDGLQAVQQAEALQPDLILVDIGLPRLNGFEVTRRIRNLVPSAKIIVVTQESSEEAVEEAFERGAQGYVLKSQAEPELLRAIDAVSKGRTFLSTGLDGNGKPL